MKANIKKFYEHVHQRLSWKGLKEARYQFAGFMLTYLVLSGFSGAPFLAVLATLVLFLAGDSIRHKHMCALAARIESKDSFFWDVEVNQVTVGSISDADYAWIRHRVFSDVRVYIAQGFNLLRVALNSFDYCFRAIPLVVLWIGVALAIFSPETISSVLAALQHATPSDMRDAVSTAGLMLALMMMLSVAFHWMFGLSRFGFINRFDEALGTAVRRRLSVAAEGGVSLTRWVDGDLRFGDQIGPV